MPADLVPVFDGHNDTLLRLELQAGTKRDRSFFEEAVFDHIDLPRAWKGGLAGGLFAMFVPSRLPLDLDRPFDPADPANFAPITQETALDFTLRLMERAREIENASDGAVVLVRSSKEIRSAIKAENLAIMLHIEGAEAIDADFKALESLQAAGLRSLGPVWSRSNIFGHGAPMACPSSPDTGPGLTDVGKALVRACNALNIQIDLSHLTEKGFWDVARITEAPLVASHSNAHAICPSARNLTDKQLDAIAESGGLVGLNFHVGFLRPDGAMRSDTSLDLMVRHTDHLITRLGEKGVGLGSDFDGCLVPATLKDAAGLPKLVDAYRSAGYGEELIARICHENWLCVLERAGV